MSEPADKAIAWETNVIENPTDSKPELYGEKVELAPAKNIEPVFVGLVKQLQPDTEAKPLLPELIPNNWLELAKSRVPVVFDEGFDLGTAGLLAAEPGAGKTFVALQLVLSVALNRPLLAGFTPSGDAKGPVAIWCGEDSLERVLQRVLAICNAHEIPYTDIDRLRRDKRLYLICDRTAPLLQANVGGSYTETDEFTELEKNALERKYSLIIVDPFVAWCGVGNENDNAQMQKAGTVLIKLAKASGGACMGVHHSNKNSARNGDMSQHASRGGSSLQGLVRWMVTLRPMTTAEAGTYNIAAEDAGRFVQVTDAKNSYAARNGGLRWLRREKGGALVSVILNECRSNQIGNALREALYDLYKKTESKGLTQREIVRNETKDTKAVSKAVKEEIGTITQQEMTEAINAALGRGCLVSKPAEEQKSGPKRMEIFPQEDWVPDEE